MVFSLESFPLYVQCISVWWGGVCLAQQEGGQEGGKYCLTTVGGCVCVGVWVCVCVCGVCVWVGGWVGGWVSNISLNYIGLLFHCSSDSSFSVLLALISGFDLVGVFRVLLPWEMLFPLVDDSLKSGDGNSYLFVTNEQGYVLYHPLLPGDFQSGVSVADLESPAVLSKMYVFVVYRDYDKIYEGLEVRVV